MVPSLDAKSPTGFQWPEGKRAAVCLTYDDGLDCHLDVAAVDLDSFNFKGTFYVPGQSGSLRKRTDEWTALAGNGHELGNHTLFHPCDGEKHDWVLPEYNLKSYTQRRIADELTVANAVLEMVDRKTERSFGYTCAEFEIVDGSFKETVMKLFPSARLDGPIPDTMDGFDVYLAPSWGVVDPTAEELIAYVNKARDMGTIATFMFHSVGGGYLNVSREAHMELLKYLDAHKEEFWVDTFHNVMEHVKTELADAGQSVD